MCLTKRPTETVYVPEDEPIIGYRFFRIGTENNDLVSLFHPVGWSAEPKQATCPLYRSNHSAPFEVCQCGFYAYSSLRMLDELDENHGPLTIPARVKMWGKIVKHGEQGYRAEHMQVIALVTQREHPGLESRKYHDGDNCSVCRELRELRKKRVERLAKLANRMGLPYDTYEQVLDKEVVAT
jgi:hypothetical protein